VVELNVYEYDSHHKMLYKYDSKGNVIECKEYSKFSDEKTFRPFIVYEYEIVYRE
jgi:hypothetical protein